MGGWVAWTGHGPPADGEAPPYVGLAVAPICSGAITACDELRSDSLLGLGRPEPLVFGAAARIGVCVWGWIR